jgi:leucyl aminopeptidase
MKFSGKFKEELILPSERGNFFLIGFGKKEKFTLQNYREAIAHAFSKAKGMKFTTLAIELPGVFETGIEAYETSFVSVVVNYKFSQFKTEKNEGIKEVKIHSKTDVSNEIETGKIIGEAVNLTRTLANLPPSVGTPTYFENEARKIKGLNVTALGREDFIRLGMGGLEGVSRASKEPAKLLIMEYKNSDTPPELIVGKGITFDSGGLSIKSAESMENMKFDKCGAAAVLGIMKAISDAKLKVHVVGITPLTENLPGGNAYKPGDILKHYNGKTSEIISTDAEGRLVLADALSYGVEKYNPAHVIDLATLTGACVVALGRNISGILSNNLDFEQRMLEVSKNTWEKLWALPLDEEFKEQIKSDVADIKNSGGKYGGAETAAAFLSYFVGDKPWVHLDMTGPYSTDKKNRFFEEGATGFGTRLIFEYLRSIAYSRSK